MEDQSLPSKKFEPKYKDTKRKTHVICYPMDMGNGHHGPVGLVTGRLDGKKKRYRKEIPGTKSIKDKKQLKGLQMSLLNL